MRLDDGLLDFLRRPLMCVIAAVDGDGRPWPGRAVGFHVLEDRETIDVIFSAWQWSRIAAAVRQTGRLAVTFVSPSDYRTFQVKGRATLRETAPGDLERADRFIKEASGELTSLGVPSQIIGPWLTAREAQVARLNVSEIYDQTPGPRAGMLAGLGTR